MILFNNINEMHQFAKEKAQSNGLKVDTSGLSSATFHEYGSAFFIKQLNYKEDALSIRTHDKGREYHLIHNQKLEPLWDIINNPYIGLAIEKDQYGLLMKHLKTEFISSIDFNMAMHHIYLKYLAKIHARFWNNSHFRDNPHFLKLSNYLEMLGPKFKIENSSLKINQLIEKGWKEAKFLLPSKSYDLLLNTESITQHYRHLPCTFIHGDYRPSNIGYNSDNQRITLIDFAFSGYAPFSVDLFWYIATTTWLGTEYEESLTFYRNELEQLIGVLDESLWTEFVEIGILVACSMQLWEKALDYDDNPDDFKFWISKLNETSLIDK